MTPRPAFLALAAVRLLFAAHASAQTPQAASEPAPLCKFNSFSGKCELPGALDSLGGDRANPTTGKDNIKKNAAPANAPHDPQSQMDSSAKPIGADMAKGVMIERLNADAPKHADLPIKVVATKKTEAAPGAYPIDEVPARVNEEFDQMLRANPGRADLINQVRTNFLQRLVQHTEPNFSAVEIDGLDAMFAHQIAYSKAMRGVIKEYPELPEAERRRIMRAVSEGRLDSISSDRGIPKELRDQLVAADAKAGGSMVVGDPTSGQQGVMSDFRISLQEAYHRLRPRAGASGGPGPSTEFPDFIPTPPDSYSKRMQDNMGADPGAWELSARGKLAKGDRSGGMADLDRAISLGGGADAYALRGALRLEAQDFDGAYRDAKKALELKPGDAGAMIVLKSAEGRTSSGARDDAGPAGARENGGVGGGDARAGSRLVAGMTTASAIASNQKLNEARRALALGDIQAAIKLAQRALELDPGNASAHGFLSAVYGRMRDYPRAIASADAGLALAPRDAGLLNNKAFAQNRSRLYRDALATSNGALEADARNPYSYANRAYAYGGLGDRVWMLSDIRRAAALDARFEKAAADAPSRQLPSSEDILFLFPGEDPAEPAVGAAPSGRGFGLVVGTALLGGLLLAFGLLSTVLAPLKESVVSAFTKATRRGPSVGLLEGIATQEPASVGGNVGGLIRGQYEVSRQIGAGGMGMVYEGTDRSLGRRVAIKKMREELRLNPRERERFIIEAKTVASLHHPNIVDIYSIVEEGEDVYLVFEFVDGRTVHELVQAKGRLTPEESVRVTRAVGDALAYAHAHGVIHRDMKPSNVMLTAAGAVKVMDFGIARMAKDALTRYSMTNTVVGTPPYMAPEQEQGIVRKESDVYSLAICAYEMLTGKLPFIGIGAGMLMNKINMSYVPPSRAIAGLPASLDDVFLKAFRADPDLRHRTPQEFAAALEAALGGARSSSNL